MLVDTFGRVATDLRVSLTDRCNLRCTYCMPAEGLAWLPKPELLTDDEIVRLVGIAVERSASTEVRFTGGEPLLRRGLVGIVERGRRRCDPRPRISLTTNGIGLAKVGRGAGRRRAGPGQRLAGHPRPRAVRRRSTRRDRLADVLAGLRRRGRRRARPGEGQRRADARASTTTRRAPLLRLCLEHGYELRFIEQMPLDAQHGWDRADDGHRRRDPGRAGGRVRPRRPVDAAERGSAPAETWLVDGGPGRVGVIGSVTRPFCGACDRTRLTADGQVRNCLFAREESDLRGALRAGAADDELAARWRAAMWRKRPGHGIDDPSFLQPARPMSAIGG